MKINLFWVVAFIGMVVVILSALPQPELRLDPDHEVICIKAYWEENPTCLDALSNKHRDTSHWYHNK